MKQAVHDHLQEVLKHLYINPLEKCNLKCKICYTRKTDPILTKDQVSDFIARYQNIQTVETVTFCGGEVFALAYFPTLVNELTAQGIFVQMITNGTIDKLDDLSRPNFVNLIVSIDGVKADHDANRGAGNFDKSIAFLQKGLRLGFHGEIFSIVHKQNIHHIDAFEKEMTKLLGQTLPITYHPRKPPTYLLHHPLSNIVGQIKDFDFLTPEEVMNLMQTKNVFPPKKLGCYQISLASDGRVYGCCEGTIPLGHMDDAVGNLVGALTKRLETWEETNTLQNCLGCSQSEFMCGIKSYLLALDRMNK